jgi:hypothetical protein
MIIDIKITTWQRIHLSDDYADEIREKIEKEEDINYYDLDFNFCEIESMDAEEFIEPDDNKGFSTIEIYEEKGENIIWQNGE